MPPMMPMRTSRTKDALRKGLLVKNSFQETEMFHAIVQCCTFMLTKSIKDAASEILFELVVGGKILLKHFQR